MIRPPSMVRLMSSQRQPQAVQVASATTVGAAWPFATSGGLSGGVDILVALIDGGNRPGATLRGTSAGRIFPESDGAVKPTGVGFRRSGHERPDSSTAT